MSSLRIHILVATVSALIFGGCASPSGTGLKRPKDPMPENLRFSGDFDAPPRWRFFPQTVFPPFLIQEGVAGEATVAFRVTEQGYVEEAKILDATHQAFGASALGTTGRMVFRPATKNGKPVPAEGTVSFTFEYQ